MDEKQGYSRRRHRGATRGNYDQDFHSKSYKLCFELSSITSGHDKGSSIVESKRKSTITSTTKASRPPLMVRKTIRYHPSLTPRTVYYAYDYRVLKGNSSESTAASPSASTTLHSRGPLQRPRREKDNHDDRDLPVPKQVILDHYRGKEYQSRWKGSKHHEEDNAPTTRHHSGPSPGSGPGLGPGPGSVLNEQKYASSSPASLGERYDMSHHLHNKESENKYKEQKNNGVIYLRAKSKVYSTDATEIELPLRPERVSLTPTRKRKPDPHDGRYEGVASKTQSFRTTSVPDDDFHTSPRLGSSNHSLEASATEERFETPPLKRKSSKECSKERGNKKFRLSKNRPMIQNSTCDGLHSSFQEDGQNEPRIFEPKLHSFFVHTSFPNLALIEEILLPRKKNVTIGSYTSIMAEIHSNEALAGPWQVQLTNRPGELLSVSFRHSSHATALQGMLYDIGKDNSASMEVSAIHPKKGRLFYLHHQQSDICDDQSESSLSLVSVSLVGFEGFPCNDTLRRMGAKRSREFLKRIEDSKDGSSPIVLRMIPAESSPFRRAIHVGACIQAPKGTSDYTLWIAQDISTSERKIVGVDIVFGAGHAGGMNPEFALGLTKETLDAHNQALQERESDESRVMNPLERLDPSQLAQSPTSHQNENRSRDKEVPAATNMADADGHPPEPANNSLSSHLQESPPEILDNFQKVDSTTMYPGVPVHRNLREFVHAGNEVSAVESSRWAMFVTPFHMAPKPNTRQPPDLPMITPTPQLQTYPHFLDSDDNVVFPADLLTSRKKLNYDVSSTMSKKTRRDKRMRTGPSLESFYPARIGTRQTPSAILRNPPVRKWPAVSDWPWWPFCRLAVILLAAVIITLGIENIHHLTMTQKLESSEFHFRYPSRGRRLVNDGADGYTRWI